ncbi:MAG: hypothetical protein HY300_05565, partial [Verrucomicrobia bacterium]|nr:hypothetical protein [Verrucomicrobiota bacterium]
METATNPPPISPMRHDTFATRSGTTPAVIARWTGLALVLACVAGCSSVNKLAINKVAD